MAATKIGHGLAKGLGIKLHYRNELDEEVRRGESVFSIQTADTYVEEEPTAVEWVTETLPSAQDLAAYARSLFPFLSWIGFYNLQWLLGDLVAGEYLTLPLIYQVSRAVYDDLNDIYICEGHIYHTYYNILYIY
jgi:sodium-independent sulfate anion transporter 11